MGVNPRRLDVTEEPRGDVVRRLMRVVGTYASSAVVAPPWIA
jgi:hypothetical protein